MIQRKHSTTWKIRPLYWGSCYYHLQWRCGEVIKKSTLMRGYRLKCWLFNFYMTSQEASGRLPAVRWKKYRSGIRFMVKPPLHQHQIVFTCVCQVAEQFFETLQHSWRIKLNVLIWSRTLNLWRPPCCRTVLPFSDIWTSCCLNQPYIYSAIIGFPKFC